MAILVRKREFRRLLLRFKHGADIKSESLAGASVPARIARLPGPRPGGLHRCGAVAQLGERRVRNAKVEGSIPFRSTNSSLATVFAGSPMMFRSIALLGGAAIVLAACVDTVLAPQPGQPMVRM